MPTTANSRVVLMNPKAEVLKAIVAELDFPTFRGHVNLALIGALGICDGHEIQYRTNTASL
jgi:hypothetical protein